MWSKPSCVQCNMTYKTLDSEGVEYQVFDLSAPENEAKLEEFKAAGLLQAPIVVPPMGDPWAGFRPDLIKQLA